MTKKNTTSEGDINDGAADLPSEPNKKGKAAGTTSPMSIDPALEGENSAHREDTISQDSVTKNDPSTAAVKATPLVRDKIPVAREAPGDGNLGREPGLTAQSESNTSEPPTEESTADELMEEHVGEVPKAANKFSLASLKSRSEEAVPRSNTKPGTITVGKPNDDTFIRTSIKPDEWAVFDFIELKTEKKLYLLTPGVVEEINALNEERAQVVIKTVKKRLIYSVTRQGDSFLWPITILDGDNDWIDSANACAEAAKEKWIRVVSNLSAERYDYVTSPSTDAPKWPAMTYEDAVLKAFDGKVIDSMGHDVLRQLLGED